jgi:hypothetical protein
MGLRLEEGRLREVLSALERISNEPVHCCCGCGAALPVGLSYIHGHHRRKLRKEQVAQIKSLAKGGTSWPTLAEMFGVTKPAISLVVNEKRWGPKGYWKA